MVSKRFSLGVLGVLALGFSALPVGAETAVVQQTTQDVIIQGENNTVIQNSEQVNRVRTRAGSRGDDAAGVVQDAWQVGDVYGDGNDVYQENSQINVIERHNTRSRSSSRVENN